MTDTDGGGASSPGPGDSDDRPNETQRPITRAWDLVARAKEHLENLSPTEVKAELEATVDDADGGGRASSTVIVDIRDYRELYLKGKIPGAVHAPRGMLEFWIDPASGYHRPVFDPSRRYILYCAGGGRSALAAKAMKDMGYPDVAHLESGFGGWEEAGYEIEDLKTDSKWIPRPQ